MDNKVYQTLWEIFQSLGAEALSLNHYNLVTRTGYGTPQLWKEFLTSREVTDWIRSEQTIIQNAELNRLINGISKSHSVGQAQIMNTLAKLSEQKILKKAQYLFTVIYHFHQNKKKHLTQ